MSVHGSIEAGAVSLSAELSPSGWLSFVLDVGAWEAHGPSVAEDFDELLAIVSAARAAALEVAESA